MKKILALILALALFCLCLTACNKDSGIHKDTGNTDENAEDAPATDGDEPATDGDDPATGDGDPATGDGEKDPSGLEDMLSEDKEGQNFGQFIPFD